LCTATVTTRDIHARLIGIGRISLFNGNVGIPPIQSKIKSFVCTYAARLCGSYGIAIVLRPSGSNNSYIMIAGTTLINCNTIANAI
jgi:hypothetical protein